MSGLDVEPQDAPNELAQRHRAVFLLQPLARAGDVIGEQDLLQGCQFRGRDGLVARQLVDGQVVPVFANVFLDPVLVGLQVEVTVERIVGNDAGLVEIVLEIGVHDLLGFGFQVLNQVAQGGAQSLELADVDALPVGLGLDALDERHLGGDLRNVALDLEGDGGAGDFGNEFGLPGVF